MEEKLPKNKRMDYWGKLDEFIKNPKYSIIFILGVPFIIVLGAVLLDSDFLLFFLFGPPIIIASYAHYTKNKLSSAFLGLLFFPPIFFYMDLAATISHPQFDRISKYLEWPYIFRDYEYFWKIWIGFAISCFLVANRKPVYLILAAVIFVASFLEFIKLFD